MPSTTYWKKGTEEPSGPGEFHPRPLTDPDVTVSGHPARATPRRPAGRPRTPTGSSRCRLARRRRAGDPPPSLPGSYPSSSLLRGGPPLTGASVLSASRVRRLRLFPWHHRQGSHVLPGTQAGVMSPLRRTPPGQSTGSRQAAPRAYLRPWFWRRRCPFDVSSGIRFRSSLQPPPDGCSRLFPDAHDRGFGPEPLLAVWSLPL